MGFFERYLTVWVLACIGIGIGLGYLVGDSITVLSDWNISTVNVPVAILVWLMIFPMMVQIDFSSIKDVSKNWKGLGLTVVVNWLIKPFSMALFAWFFFYFLYRFFRMMFSIK
jgi:ACR3 family arsenite transporter